MGWFGWRENTTLGVLVAGRSYDFSDFNRRQILELCEAIDAIAARAGAPIVTVPADADLTDEGAGDEDEAFCSAFVGVLIAAGGTHEPLLVTREAMLDALGRARAIPASVWAEITEAYRAAGGKQPSDEAVIVRLACTGPLPMAKFAFGQLGPADAELGGRFVRGQGPHQNPHEIGVHGISVAHCSYDGSPAEPFDVGDEAHAARVAAHPNGAYYLVAQFD